MSAATSTSWHEANQRSLTAALAEVRQALERHAARSHDLVADGEPGTSAHQALLREAAATPACAREQSAGTGLFAPPALETLCKMFGLSLFERQILLLCAGMEFDSFFMALCASAQGDPRRTYPTFSLALAALPEPHWSALSPAGPLRYWRLIEVGTGEGLSMSPLRIDERIVHYLTGVRHLDDRLIGFFSPVQGTKGLVPSHRALAKRLAAIWSRAAANGPLPVVQLCGDDRASQLAVAAEACAMVGLDLHVMPAQVVPLEPRELEALMRLWDREAALTASALLMDCGEMDASDAAREGALARFTEGTQGAFILAGRERRSALHRRMITLEMGSPTAEEQRTVWKNGLGTRASNLNGGVETLVTQFSLSVPTIHAVCAEALARLGEGGSAESPEDLSTVLWDVCRVQARPRFENLAQRIDPVATWEDLVVPEAQLRSLREIAVHVRQRMTVYEKWGFAAKSSRGLGISALFAGASGTGKTMAAEVLANELQLDLYRIDLSQVVNKYIGETEKNLRRVFDAAEEGGAILLFDEADALFGKRSEVKDSHDRYANIEVSYLLQRMETYRGLAILTTNMKSALDTAFLRRIRFIVQFPFPDAAQRAEIWRRIFPTDTPTAGLDVSRLARLNVAGGNIHNIALHAAFLAADTGEPVRMAHLLRAARTEYAKLEKSLTEAEIRGWI
jgi:ATP-dependent 26S proteasome regulatory subunit